MHNTKGLYGLLKILLGIGSCAVLLALSCSDINQPDPAVDATLGPASGDPAERRYADRATRDDLITYLEHAYRSEYPGLYADALHGSFLFVFTLDVADSLGLPPDQPWWGKTNDVNSTRTMFLAPEVTSIEIDLHKPGDWFPCMDIRPGSEPDTLYGFCARFEPYIMVTIAEAGEEGLILLVNDTFLDIMVVPDPEFEGLWVVARIKEVYKSPAILGASRPRRMLVETCSWGLIKSLFR
jgi:hypothetical protein